MFSSRAHPWKSLLAGWIALAGSPAWGCGVAAEEATVARVDERGDIHFQDGRPARLAGIDATGARARDIFARGWEGKSVRIALLAPRPDRWGRWLVDIFDQAGGSAAIDLLSAGAALVRPEFETKGCETERLEAESAARAAHEGLWSERGAVLDPTDLETLALHDGRFALIEGTVRRVGVGRSRVYLDFGRRGGFTAVVARKLDSAFSRRGVSLATLAGSRIRVRGVLENRFGPRIEIVDPLMIERAEGP